MKKLFLLLLRKYSKSEEQRLEVYKVLAEQTSNTYREQTTFGNVYNAHIEFVMANEFVCKNVKSKDIKSLKMIGSGLKEAYKRALLFLVTEHGLSPFDKDLEKVLFIDLEDEKNNK